MNSAVPISGYARYLPPLLLDHLDRRQAERDWAHPSRSYAAVLSVDLTGFSSLATQLAEKGHEGAERLSRVLDVTFGSLIETIGDHGGEVVQFAGDAMLALWRTDGADRLDDVTARACQCALDLHHALDSPELIDVLGGHRVEAYAGLANGQVLVGGLGGHEDRWTFAVAGQPVTVASAAASTARPGESLLAAETSLVPARGVHGEARGDGLLRIQKVDELKSWSAATPNGRDEAIAGALQFVPSSIVTRLRSGQKSWLAEFRPASVLFVTLGDSVVQSPADYRRLHRWVSACQEVIDELGGCLLQVVVESGAPVLLAAWGLPFHTHEDDATRALEAAHRAQDRLEALGVVPRCGVATGRVFTGDRGSRERCELAVIGSVVNLAARLMQASDGGTLCDVATRDAAQSDYRLEELAPLELKGVQGTVPVFRPLGRRATESREARVLRGRDAELAELTQALDGLQSGHGGLAVVEGKAGFGKTQLLEAFLALARERGVRCVRGGAAALDGAAPYHVWRGILDDLLQLGPDASAADRAGALRRSLADRPELLERAALLQAIAPLALPESTETRRLDGAARAVATGSLLAELLTGAGGAVVLAVEDLHWADAASCAAVLQLLRDEAAVLVVLTTRPQDPSDSPERSSLLSWPSARRVALAGLPDDAVVEMVCDRLGVERLSEAIAHWVLDKSEGNPFFAEQLAFSLRDTGLVLIDGRRARLAEQVGELDALDLPVTAEGVLQSRIDGLDPADAMVLKVGSVIGREFGVELLRGVLEVVDGADDVENRLESLVRSHLVEPAEGTGYRFVHALAQDSCYGSLLFAHRRELHAAVAERLAGDEDGVAPDALLAHHWLHAENPVRACRSAERAGLQALHSGAHREAALFYNRALEQLEQHPEELAGVVDDERRAHWQGQLGVALHALGDFPRAEAHLLRSLELRRLSGPRTPLAWSAAAATGAGRQLAHRLHAVRLARRPGLSEPAAVAQRLCEKYFFERQFVPMVGSSLMAVNYAELSGSRSNLARSYAMLSVICGVCRLSPLARFYYLQARQVAEEQDDLRGRVFNGYARCVTLCGTASLAEGREAALDVVDLSHQLGDPQEVEMVHAALANNAYFRGDLEGTLHHHGIVRDSARRRGSALHEAWGSYGSAFALLSMGRLRDGEERVRDALELLLEAGEPVSEHICRALLADIHLERGDLEMALDEASVAEGLMQKSPPSLFTELESYAAVARVRLAALEAASGVTDGQALREGVRRALSALRRFVMLFPLGRPRSLTLHARAHRLSGRARRARRTAQRAVHAANRLGMRYEEAVARRELARCSAAVPRSEELLADVDRLLSEMGCVVQATQLSR